MRIAYATELSAPADQLVGWGLKVVMDGALEEGWQVHHVHLPPREGDSARYLVDPPDVWLLSLPYAGNLHYARQFFELIGQPIDRRERSGRTLFVLGGHAVVTPDPLLDIFDAVFVGECDDVIPQLFAALPDRAALREVPGILMDPGGEVWFQLASSLHRRTFYEASYDDEDQSGVGRTKYLEIARGCSVGCRFCELGWAYGQNYVERSREEVEQLIEDAVACGTPRQDIVLSAPHTDGVRWYHEMVADGTYDPRWRSTTVWRYRKAPQAAPSGKRGRIRFGVEGVTERLRVMAGKAITDEHLRESMQRAVDEGYRMLRLFFIAGLPTETAEDRMHMQEVLAIGASLRGLRHWKAIDVKVTGLSPQPMTPWARLGIAPAIEAVEEYRSVRRVMQGAVQQWRTVMVDTHSTEADVVKHMRAGEALAFLRERKGDRRSDIESAARRAGVDYDRILTGYGIDDPVPWGNVRHPAEGRQRRAEERWFRQQRSPHDLECE